MKIYKTLLPIIVGIGLPAIVVPTTLSVALNQKTQLSAVDITTVIPNNANIGVFTSQPTANEVIARLKQNYSTLYDNQIQCSSPTTTSATITPVTGSDIYSGTTNVVFNMTPTSTNSLLSFFGLSLSGGSYDVTTNQN
jgi:hypothetical protein